MIAIQFLITILKFALLLYLIYILGFLYGILCFTALLFFRIYLIKLIFGIEKLTGSDLSICSDDVQLRSNVLVVIVLEDFDLEKFFNSFQSKLAKIIKFKLQLVRIFFNYYWKTVPEEELKKRFFILNPFRTEEDFIYYCKEEVNKFIDIFNELPYTINIGQIGHPSEKKGCLLIKIDHILSDGLGIVTALCTMANNYTLELFPKVMQNYSKISLWKKILYEIIIQLSFIYYGLVVLYQTQTWKGSNTSLKVKTKPLGNSYLGISKHYDLATSLKKCKELGITFNDMVMTVVSKVFTKMSEESGYKNIDNFITLVPIGRNPLPKDIKHLNIGNFTASTNVYVPSVKSFMEGYKTMSKVLKRQLNSIGYSVAVTNLTLLLNEIFPMWMTFKLGNNYCERLDYICSNLPGPTQQLVYDGGKIISMYPFITAGRLKIFVPIVSYNGRYTIAISVNEACSLIDKDKFLRYFDEEISVLAKEVKID